MNAEGATTTSTTCTTASPPYLTYDLKRFLPGLHGPPRPPCRLLPRCDASATPPDAANQHQPAQGRHPPHHRDCGEPIYAVPPPEEPPPPSYDDAIHSSTSPLLGGPPPDYGAFRAFVDPDEFSEASSEVDDTEQYLPERVGQAFTVCILVGILYLFWSIITKPDPDDSLHG